MEAESPHAGDGGPHRYHDECYACPIGGFFLTARSASPDTFEHLLSAASELVAAARSMVEVAERVVEQQRTSPHASGSSRVQRIDLAD